MKRIFRLLPLATIVIGVIATAPQAYANELDISIYPPITEIIATAQASLKAPISISNLGNEAQKLKVTITPFEAASEDGTVRLIEEKPADLISSMIKLEKDAEPISKISLRPSETAQLSLAVTVGKEASLSEHIGDHYLAVLFQTVNEREIKQPTSRIEAAIGTIVLLSIRDPAMQPISNVRLKEFLTERLFTGEPIRFSLLIENQSSHFIKAKGKISVHDISGREIETISLPAQNVLAGSTRNLISDGSLMQSQKLFGRYKAEAKVDIGDGIVLYETLTFYAVPKKIGIISLIILFASVGVILRFRSYSQRLVAKEQKNSTRLGRQKSKRKMNLAK